jgi:hypothetical protein
MQIITVRWESLSLGLNNSHKLESNVREGKYDLLDEYSLLFIPYMIELLRTGRNYWVRKDWLRIAKFINYFYSNYTQWLGQASVTLLEESSGCGGLWVMPEAGARHVEHATSVLGRSFKLRNALWQGRGVSVLVCVEVCKWNKMVNGGIGTILVAILYLRIKYLSGLIIVGVIAELNW